MNEPDKDPEFGPYFSKKWSDMLRITLHNFLSTILFNTPSPKVRFCRTILVSDRDLDAVYSSGFHFVLYFCQLLMLERWFRSDSQEDIRRHLKEARDKLSEHLHRENIYEDRLVTLQGALKDLVKHIHSLNMKELSLPQGPSLSPLSSLGMNNDASYSDSGRHEIILRESINISDFDKV